MHDLFAAEPGELQEVHDLFAAAPADVEEWQIAGSEPWVVAGIEPFVVPDQVLAEPVPVSFAPAAYDVEPVSELGGPEVDGIQWLPAPDAPSFVVEPPVQDLPAAEATVVVEPAVEPVVEPFAWSPWAQEMGLGAAPVVATKPASFDGQGFADMVEDIASHGHTAAAPVPLAPASGFVEGRGTLPAFADTPEVEQFVPQPRDAGDSAVMPEPLDQATGAHAAVVEPAWATVEAQVAQPASVEEPQQESAPDPLAGGLLAHLMSSVRGL